MSRAISLVVSLALGVSSLAVSTPAQACKCMLPPVASAREDASALFEGRVLAIAQVEADASATNGELRVTLAVVRTWKGLEREERVDLLTNGSSAACGYTFAKDVSYLVYAREQEGRLYVSSCSRTRPLADAGEDLKFLGAGSTPVQIGPKGKASEAGVSASPGSGLDAAVSQAAAKPRRSGGCAALPASRVSVDWAFTLALLALTAASRGRRRSRIAR